MHAPAPLPPSLEEARFEGLREFSFRFGVMAAVLPLILLLRDVLLFPAWILHSLSMRLLVVLLLLVYPLALKTRAPRALLPWLLYLPMGLVEVLILRDVVGLPHGVYQWVPLYFILLGPLLGLPFRLRTNLLGLAWLMLAPTALCFMPQSAGFSLLQFHLMAQPACGIMAYLLVLLGRMAEANHRYRLEIEFLALRDALTGLHNRRHFMQAGALALRQAVRGGRTTCLLMLDIDHFKSVNDRFGHGAGDQVIRAAGQGLRDSLRETDLVARIGGEEFAALLVDTDAQAALVAAERARLHLEALEVTVEGQPQPLRFTVSLGLAEARPDANLEALMERADQGLYAAKHAGRNRVAVA